MNGGPCIVRGIGLVQRTHHQPEESLSAVGLRAQFNLNREEQEDDERHPCRSDEPLMEHKPVLPVAVR